MSPQSSPNAPSTGWSVEYQQETVDLGPDGRAVQGVKVGFVTGKGVHASVFLSKARYTPDNVRAAIAAAAAQIDAVHTLTG
jgi:hypothetical protein